MAEVPIIYTGRGFAPNIPKDDGRAMSRLSEFITKAEELKYQTFRQNEQEFLKNANIDPVFFISTANQATQAKALDVYKKRWAQKMKDSNNNLSTEDKQSMLAEKNYLIAMQQKMQSDQDLWLQHRNMIIQNPNKYDAEEWSAFDKTYRETGEYLPLMPPIKAKSLDMALEDNPITTGTIWGNTETEERGGLSGFVDVKYYGDEAQGRQRVKDVAMMDEAYTKDLVKQFSNLDEATKLQYLDVSPKDGTISSQEAKDFNPIIKWAQDTKWRSAVKKERTAWRSTERARTGATQSELAQNPIGQKRTIDVGYGGIARPNMYSLGGTKLLKDVPTKGAFALDDVSASDYALSGNLARAYLKDYDADRKTFIVQTTARDPLSGIETNQLIEIPSANLDYLKDETPIVVNGKKMTIREFETSQNVMSNVPTRAEWAKTKKLGEDTSLVAYMKEVHGQTK